MKKKTSKKISKNLSLAVKILFILLIIESIILVVKIIKNNNESVHYTITNDLVTSGKKYIAVGMSDFKNSKLNKYKKPGYIKPTIWKLNSKKQPIIEEKLDIGYNGYYNSIIKTNDGYIAVGAIEMSKKQHEEKSSEAIIVKYDRNLNVKWRKNLSILDVNEFISVKKDSNNNYIVVGKSLYADGYIGNHETGGAILLRYDKDGNETLRVNYGGPQKGQFNNLIVEQDGYVVVGVYSTNTGVIKKYDKDGNEMWHSYYGLTDSKGITSITKDEDKYYVTATKLESKENKKYEASIISYDLNGNRIDEITYKKEEVTRFEDIKVVNNQIIAVGITVTDVKNNPKNSGIIVTYDKDLNYIKEDITKGENNVTFNKIYKDFVIGNTNSKLKEYKTNNHDYLTIYKDIKKD